MLRWELDAGLTSLALAVLRTEAKSATSPLCKTNRLFW
jgi:hypothetical protein